MVRLWKGESIAMTEQGMNRAYIDTRGIVSICKPVLIIRREHAPCIEHQDNGRVYCTAIDGLIVAAKAQDMSEEHNLCSQCFNREQLDVTQRMHALLNGIPEVQLYSYGLRLRFAGWSIETLRPAIIITTRFSQLHDALLEPLWRRAVVLTNSQECDVDFYVVLHPRYAATSDRKVSSFIVAGRLAPRPGDRNTSTGTPDGQHGIDVAKGGNSDAFIGAEEPLATRPKRARSELTSLISSQVSTELKEFARMAKRLRTIFQRSNNDRGEEHGGLGSVYDILFGRAIWSMR